MTYQNDLRLGGGVLAAFPTPILKLRDERAERINPELRRLILARAATSPSHDRSNVNGWHSEPDLLAWPGDAVAELRELIRHGIRRMLEVVSSDAKAVPDDAEIAAWANVLGPGGYHKIHNHPTAALSGVYYVDAGHADAADPHSGLIEFLDPRLGVDIARVPGNPFGGKLRVRPVTGELLLFPGWLYHYVNPYSGSGERISIAFNVTFR